jgi:hypothetical protein
VEVNKSHTEILENKYGNSSYHNWKQCDEENEDVRNDVKWERDHPLGIYFHVIYLEEGMSWFESKPYPSGLLQPKTL